MTPTATHLPAPAPAPAPDPDVLVIGSGIMSATVASLIKVLDPARTIQLYESTTELAQESSHGWNNAGTGHAGLCELSYTPHRDAAGEVDISKAVEIFAQFELSRQFWSYAVASGMISTPADFITPIPHISFVHGAAEVDFLRARHRAMAAHPFFQGMEFTTDRATIASWAPLLMAGREDVPVAATRMAGGTDVNFGVIARKLLGWLAAQPGSGVASGHRVTGLEPHAGGWQVQVRDLATGRTHRTRARFVFIGAGGGSLRLLQQSGIPESRGLGGFPIGGQWLVCDNPEVVRQHHAKVYGQALASAPTMAVPHLDTRLLDGKRTLLFGPFAAWTTRFLHGRGSPLDLPRSVRPDNVGTLLRIGVGNVPLVRYLMQQGTQSKGDRIATLRLFYPQARAEDWRLIDAGIRVQAIKRSDGRAGIVHYGTEVITDAAHTVAALLGASPGASVSVSIALDVLRLCLPELLASAAGQARLQEIFPDPTPDPAASMQDEADTRAALRAALREKTDRVLFG